MRGLWAVPVWLLFVAAGVQIHGAGVPEGMYPISPAMLARVLAKEGASIPVSDINVPDGVVARGAEPAFSVLSIEPATGTSNRYWVRMGCQKASDCLPFYASVASAKPLACGVRQQATGHFAPATPPVMRVGDHARLVIHNGSSIIELSVVALESGSIGQSIRIATPDYKRVLHGQVVGAGQLEGTM